MIEIVKGDISKVVCDAIVNPANTLGLMGGGVSLALKLRGGKEIEKEAREKAPIPLGGAVATGAGSLSARYVIHAPTVRYPGDKADPDVVRRAVESALLLAEELGVKCVAFPGMGTGVGGIPEEVGARILVETISALMPRLRKIKRILLVAYTDDFKEALEREWRRVFGIVNQ